MFSDSQLSELFVGCGVGVHLSKLRLPNCIPGYEMLRNHWGRKSVTSSYGQLGLHLHAYIAAKWQMLAFNSRDTTFLLLK